MKTVDIIIPCYNYANYLPDTIESVLGQSHPANRIIVIDDGSEDNTREVVEKYPDVEYHYQTNQGLSGARNKGLGISEAEYVVFLDADDILYADAIRSNLSLMNIPEEVAFVAGCYDIFDDASGNVIAISQKPAHESIYQSLLERCFIGCPASVLYDRLVLCRLGGFDAEMSPCEDYDVYLRLSQNMRAIINSDLVARYRSHDGSMSSDSTKMLVHIIKALERQSEAAMSNSKCSDSYKKGMKRIKLNYGTRVLRESFSQLFQFQFKGSMSRLFILFRISSILPFHCLVAYLLRKLTRSMSVFFI